MMFRNIAVWRRPTMRRVERILEATSMDQLQLPTGTARACCADGCTKVERRVANNHFTMALADMSPWNTTNCVDTLRNCSKCQSV